MTIFAIAVFCFGALLSLIGMIMLLVAAFRQHIGWGLASLFIPLAQLVFVAVHWERARTGFMVSLFGALALFGSIFSFGDAGMAKQATAYMAKKAAVLQEQGLKAAVAQMTESVKSGGQAPLEKASAAELEERLRAARVEFAALQQKVTADFAKLSERRAKLGKDEAAIKEYNAVVAAYELEKASMDAKSAEVASLMQQADEATLQELAAAREANSKGGKKPSMLGGMFGAPKKAKEAASAARSNFRGEVVLYSTQSCGYCTKAKQYFAKKGVQYREVDVQKDKQGAEEFRKLGGRGVPLIVVNGETIRGFDQNRLDALL